MSSRPGLNPAEPQAQITDVTSACEPFAAEMVSSAADRVRQAVRPDSPAETLRQLAQDSDILVRAAVAINRGCGPDIDSILATDGDDRVRALLGRRVARLLPDLDGLNQDTVADHVLSILGTLARDQASRVRAAIAEEIKGMEVAPRDLVVLLAQDQDAEVSDPVLRLSPVLTDADLLMLIATPPSTRSAESIAGRKLLSAAVADAIVAHADAPAIRTLLANQSACIQEATLDALVGRAPRHTDWHAPLIRRPHLSTNAVRALSEFIAADLLRILATRVDLDPSKLEAVRQRLAFESSFGEEKSMMLEAEGLKERGNLSEDLLLDAARIGHSRRVAILLAVAAGVPLQAVDRVIELRGAKALVSLAWRAGFTMRAGVAAQAALIHFSPDHLLRPTVSGDFPLSREEMDWQMELLAPVEPQPADATVA